MSPKVVAIPVFIRAFRLEQFFYERWAQPLSERGGFAMRRDTAFPNISCKSRALRRASSAIRLLCMSVKLINSSALLDVTDEAHIDEPLGIGGFSTGIARGGEIEDGLDGGRYRVGRAGKLFQDKGLIGVFQSFAILDAKIFLHDFQSRFAIGFGIVNRFDDDAHSAPDRIFIGLNVGPSGYQSSLQKRNAQLRAVGQDAEP